MTIDSLRSLQKRIREATGPDRELDWLILSNVSMPWLAGKARSWLDDQYVDADGRIRDPEEICWISWEDGKRRYEHCPHFTTDPDGLGACVALMREAVDGTWGRDEDGRFWVRRGDIKTNSRWHKNACIEFLDAIVSARIAVIAEEEAREATQCLTTHTSSTS